VHLAVKASLGATGKTAAVTAARKNGPSSSSAARAPSRNPAATDLLTRGRKIANHFHQSTASVGVLNSVPFPGDEEPRKLLTESPGRWGSIYLALVRLFTLMPRLIGFGELPDLTPAQQRQWQGRDDWAQVRHLIGVLQPAYEACIAVQSSSATVADVFELVCKLRRTMRLEQFPCPRAYDKPEAVGRGAILEFFARDGCKTDVMELDNRLYKHKDVPVKSSRGVDGLRDGAATFIAIIRDELDRRFFSAVNDTKNWLANDAVLAATLVTPGGAAMMRKTASRVGQDDPTSRATAAVMATAVHLMDERASVPSREGELEQERKKCRTTLADWDSENSRGAAEDTVADLVLHELERFLSTHVSRDVYGALNFCSVRGDDYPLLRRVACALLGASGSSAASERDFSVAGMVLRKDRSTLLPAHVEMHCLIRFNARLVPSDLSSIPVLTQAARLSARADMRPISVDMPLSAESSGDLTSSDSDTFLVLTDEEEE